MIAVYAKDALSYFQVKFWFKPFRWGRVENQLTMTQSLNYPLKLVSEDIGRKVESLIQIQLQHDLCIKKNKCSENCAWRFR